MRSSTSTRETLEPQRPFLCSARLWGRAVLSWSRWIFMAFLAVLYLLDVAPFCEIVSFCRCFTCNSQNRPCKIVEMSTSKTGKHGHAKVHMVALDIFTGEEEMFGWKKIAHYTFQARSWRTSAPPRTTWRCRMWSGRIISWSVSMTTSSPSWMILEIWGWWQNNLPYLKVTTGRI